MANLDYAKHFESVMQALTSRGLLVGSYDANGKPNGQPVKNHDWTQATDLYMTYRTWCEANGHRKPVASPEFKRRTDPKATLVPLAEVVGLIGQVLAEMKRS